MSFDWVEYIELAEQLAESNDEASRRAAISRAYYGAFNLARRWVQRHTHVNLPGTGKDHQRVIDELKSQDHPNAIQMVGEKLTRLRTRRGHADYRDTYGQRGSRPPRDPAGALERDMRFALRDARAIQETIAEYDAI